MEAICIGLSAIIKAVHSSDGRRLCEVECSNESVDLEGDVILQRALLGSAASFVKHGHIDIDHLSEIGARLGIPNPESFIIGRPIEVKDLGKGRTGVVSEIMQTADGKVDVAKNRFDGFWQSLQSKPPVMWRASVYGFPHEDAVTDCRTEKCEVPASRYLVKGMDWRSLAMTRKPINDAIKGYARIVTAKAMIEELRKDSITPFFGSDTTGSERGSPLSQMTTVSQEFPQAPFYPHITPKSINEMWGQYDLHMSKDCQHVMGYNGTPFHTTKGFEDHFKMCCGAEPEQAEVLSHALMYLLLRRKNSDMI